MPIVHLSLIRPDLVEFDYLNSKSRPYYLVLRSLRTISMAFWCMVKQSFNFWTKKNRGESKGSEHLRKLMAYSFLIALCGAILSWQTENFDNSYLFIDSFSVHHLSGYDKHHAFRVMENHFMNFEKSGLYQWSDHPFTLGFNITFMQSRVNARFWSFLSESARQTRLAFGQAHFKAHVLLCQWSENPTADQLPRTFC